MSCTDITVQIIGDITDINVIVKRAQDAATAAGESAANAATSASESAASALEAKGYADSAALSKQDSLDYSVQAANSASQAATSAVDASDKALEARTAAGIADTRATEAENSAQSASQSASAAAQSASDANAAADRAENAPANIKCEQDGNDVTTTTSTLNFKGGYATVTSPSPGVAEVDIPPPSVSDVSGLQAALDGKEPALGNPTSDYQVLASTVSGSRHWITPQSGGGSGVALEVGGVGQVQHPVDDILLGDGLSFTVSGRVITLRADVTQSEIDNLQQQINNIHAPTAAEFEAAFNQLIAPYASRISTVETEVSNASQAVSSLTNQLNTALQTIQSLQNSKIDSVDSHVNASNKTITLTFKSGQTVVDTDLIDISSMFNANPPDQQHNIWFGFTTSKPPTEAQVKAGQSDQDSVITGHDITLQRDTASPAYMFVWVPDSLGPVNGFSFSHAFTDVWQSYALDVDGVTGKVYVSDNQTNSTNVSFEVM